MHPFNNHGNMDRTTRHHSRLLDSRPLTAKHHQSMIFDYFHAGARKSSNGKSKTLASPYAPWALARHQEKDAGAEFDHQPALESPSTWSMSRSTPAAWCPTKGYPVAKLVLTWNYVGYFMVKVDDFCGSILGNYSQKLQVILPSFEV